MKELHFELKKRGRFFRLRPDNLAAIKRLTFKEGSAIFAGILKTSERVLRKRGFTSKPVHPGTVLQINPFAVLTGKKPVPLTLVHPAEKPKADGGTVPIYPPIIVCMNCKGDGGCTGHIWK